MATPSLLKCTQLFWALIAGASFSSLLGSEQPKVGLDQALPFDFGKHADRVEQELRGNILKFWLEHTRDRENGGFFGEIDNGLAVRKDAPRGALLTSRVLWTFSAAYERYHDPEYLEMAQWAYNDLMAHFWDGEYGGLFWSVSSKGVPLDPRKISYVQAFGIYGLAEYHRATGEKAPLDRAIELYELMEKNSHDRVNRGYFEEFSRDWKNSRERGPGRSAMGSLGQKSQNVHLHILEAYTNLYRVWPTSELRANLFEVVEVLRHKIFDASTNHLRLFLDEDWRVRSNEISFGHDIEFSWLLVEAAETLGDEALLREVRSQAVAIARATLIEGVDPDGGVLGEADPHGITNSFKEWWPQAEATVGFFNAYQISGDKIFLDASLHSWEFIETHLVDRIHGEWFIGVSRKGKVERSVKVSFWKCPYHNGRACMELLDRLRFNAVHP